jgi:large subunit ribosomal protein L13
LAAEAKTVEPIVIDGKNAIMGRVASIAAKLILKGNTVYVVNVESLLISGGKRAIIKGRKEFLEVGSVVNPEHGPIHFRRPDNIFARTVRGMLPWREPKGKTAFHRLRAYHGYPDDLRKYKPMDISKCMAKKPASFYLSLGDLAKELGWKE